MRFSSIPTIQIMWESFEKVYSGNLEKLKISHPFMEREEMDEKAAEITTKFFYFLEKENLPYYWERLTSWRADLR